MSETGNQRIKRILEISKKVIRDGCFENGAIVAANPTQNYYPPEAKHYFYVWPRDASYICIAADILEIKDIQENFFNWCVNRAEEFRETGLFFEKYYVNGLKESTHFQPDQTGSVLFSVWHHFKKKPEDALKHKELIELAANGLCDKWNGTNFELITNDLWEERFTFPDLKDNFTYSLAACLRGLECANELIPNSTWAKTAEEMRNSLNKHFIDNYFARSYGKLIDKDIDSSILGLVYPFEIYNANDHRIISTINKIKERIVINGGLHRYEMDKYDGWYCKGHHRNKGAGAWPLLNFWMSIYYAIKGDSDQAEEFYNWVVDRVDSYLPEQIFDNDLQVSVSPLLWSHAMFIIASNFLGYIEQKEQ